MKLVMVEKPYSWLQWPVQLLNCEKKNLHITAKFFGAATINHRHVRAMTEDVAPFYPVQHFEWRANMFGPNKTDYVLELTKVPTSMIIVHQAFGLIQDQYSPHRFHITVPDLYWAKVQSENLTPLSEGLHIGELELCVGTPSRIAEARNGNH